MKAIGRLLRPLALLLSVILTFTSLSACAGKSSATLPPPVDDSRGAAVVNPSRAEQPEVKKGLSLKQKGVLLAGAAALYYLYNQHKNSQEQGPNGQYYLSKNGRVYYRDAQHRAHYVTPPPNGIRVSEAEARQYRNFQGYNNSPTGRDLTSLGAATAPAM
ncbi:MAG: hypothetical protein JOZ78_18405 [Chroococcidiopsidaceae cyanobacterium CP_BM_ER_R8_30]|nr:hypothetical protein [Chroococcidiopsidaceae cyanobacterium CP_BM_ER_R8_30]